MLEADDLFGGSVRRQAYVQISLITSVIGTMASLITIILILRMRPITEHVHLLLIMTVYQLMYDLSFFPSAVNLGYYETVVFNSFQILGGVASSLVSNWIAYIAMHIVLYRQKVDVFKIIKIIHVTCFLPGFAGAVVYIRAFIPKSTSNSGLGELSVVYIYNNIRLFSIFLNFVFVVVIAFRIFRHNGDVQSPQEVAIRTLCRRMVYYPVLQAVGRSGYTWYEFAYGDNFNTDDATDIQYSSMMFASIITPIVSVGYLLIFLIMQPHAYNEFKALLSCRKVEKRENELRDGSIASRVRPTSARFTNEIQEFDVDPEQVMSNQQEAEKSLRQLSVGDWVRYSVNNVFLDRTVTVDFRPEEELYETMFDQGRATYAEQQQPEPFRATDQSFRPSDFPVSFSMQSNNFFSGNIELQSRENPIYETENVLHQDR